VWCAVGAIQLSESSRRTWHGPCINQLQLHHDQWHCNMKIKFPSEFMKHSTGWKAEVSRSIGRSHRSVDIRNQNNEFQIFLTGESHDVNEQLLVTESTTS
jgi:hypothetical protein